MDSRRPNPSRVRLQKYLALCGLGSRRGCEGLIAAGRVSVNGQAVTEQGVSVDPDSDAVEVDRRIVRPQGFVYILFNKPRDVLCTCLDPRGRRTFRDFLPDLPARMFHVGRLDRNSEGLLILTNDGDFAQAVAHPRHHIEKVYHAWVDRALSPEELGRMVDGIRDEGEMLHADAVRPHAVPRGEGRGYEIVLSQGRNRQIRRMLESLGVGIRQLRRVAIGDLSIAGVRVGCWRHLTPAEIRNLRRAAADEEGQKA